MNPTEVLIERILSLPLARYVAVRTGSTVVARQRPDIQDASSAESDAFEERVVNPTALTLFTRRGEIDCGGLQYLVIRYGNFLQCVVPLPDGHVSVAFEPEADLQEAITRLLPPVGSLGRTPTCAS